MFSSRRYMAIAQRFSTSMLASRLTLKDFARDAPFSVYAKGRSSEIGQQKLYLLNLKFPDVSHH